MNFVALDFETANYAPTSICQIGISVFENGTVIDRQSIFVRPEPFYFAPRNVEIHGISYQHTAKMPNFAQYWNNIRHYFDNRTLIAHNSAFDFNVLYKTLLHFNLPMPSLEFYCTLMISKKLLKGYNSYSLHNLCSNFGIEFRHHDAAEDAQAAGLLMVEILKKYNFDTLDQLAENFNFSKGVITPTQFKHFKTTNGN